MTTPEPDKSNTPRWDAVAALVVTFAFILLLVKL